MSKINKETNKGIQQWPDDILLPEKQYSLHLQATTVNKNAFAYKDSLWHF